jgi:hypothetical protein
MPFWSENFGQDRTKKDPKRNFRFIVEFGGINATPVGAVAWYAKTVAKPSFTIANAEHKYLNHTFYYPAGVTWSPITITMVDPVDPDMAATFSDIIVSITLRYDWARIETTNDSKAVTPGGREFFKV